MVDRRSAEAVMKDWKLKRDLLARLAGKQDTLAELEKAQTRFLAAHMSSTDRRTMLIEGRVTVDITRLAPDVRAQAQKTGALIEGIREEIRALTGMLTPA